MQLTGDTDVFPDDILESLELLDLAIKHGRIGSLAFNLPDGSVRYDLVVFLQHEDGHVVHFVVGEITPQLSTPKTHEPTSALQPSTLQH